MAGNTQFKWYWLLVFLGLPVLILVILAGIGNQPEVSTPSPAVVAQRTPSPTPHSAEATVPSTGFTIVYNGHRIPGPVPSKVGGYRFLETELIRQGQRLAVRTYVLFPQTLTHDQLGPTAMQAALGQASKFDAGWVELRALAAESCIGKGSQVARVLFSNDGKGAIPAYSAPTWEIEIVPEGCWPWSVEEIAAANYRCKTQGMDSKFRDQNGLLQDEAWRAQMRKDLGISNTEWYRRADKAMSCVTSETFQP